MHADSGVIVRRLVDDEVTTGASRNTTRVNIAKGLEVHFFIAKIVK